MAPAGQTEMHAPQPVHAAAETTGRGACPAVRGNSMAPSMHTSRQLSHRIPRFGRHWSETRILSAHAGARAKSNTGTVQLLAQSPQNVQEPAAKSTSGRPPASARKILSGQEAMQAPHCVQCSVSEDSLDQGGRMAPGRAV